MTWKSAARFYRQLGLVHRAGIPVSQAVAMAGEASLATHRQLAPAWSRGCEGGSELAPQLAAAGETPLAVALVRAGERAGRVPEMAAMLADHFDHLLTLRSLVIARLAYPVALLHVALMVPALPGVVLGRLEAWWLLVGPGVLWAITLGLLAAETGLRRGGVSARLVLRGPLAFVAMPMLVANAFRTLRAGATAGMLVPDTLELAAGATGNRVLAERLSSAAAQVRQGRLPDLPSALAQAGFPADAVRHVANGDRAGKVEEALDQWATVCEEQFRSRTLWSAKILTGTIYGLAMLCAVIVIFSMMAGYAQALGDAVESIE